MSRFCTISRFTYVRFFSALVISRMSRFCNDVRAAQIDDDMIAVNHQEAKIANRQNVTFLRFHVFMYVSFFSISHFTYVTFLQLCKSRPNRWGDDCSEPPGGKDCQQAECVFTFSHMSHFFNTSHFTYVLFLQLCKSRPNRWWDDCSKPPGGKDCRFTYITFLSPLLISRFCDYVHITLKEPPK